MAKKPKKEEASNEEAAEKKGLMGNKLFLFGGAGIAVLALAGGGAFFLLGGESDPAAVTAAMIKETAKVAYYYDLPVMIVNLASADNRATYVKLEMALEVPEEEMIEILAPNLPRVLDAFQIYLRELRASDLEGSAGLFRLKEELQRRVNLAVYPARVDDVLFKNVVVQ